MTILSGGNVGIGTTVPGSSLHVAGDITSAPSGSGIHLGYASNYYGVIQSNGVSGSVIDFSSTGVDYKGRLLYDNSNNYLDISTNGAFAMRNNSGGNVGIVTTSPIGKLQIGGTSGNLLTVGTLTNDWGGDVAIGVTTGNGVIISKINSRI
jgi:hypothetical protein